MLRKFAFFLILIFLILILPEFILAQEFEYPSMPGRVEATGTRFEIKDSDYLNIALKSSEPIRIILESMPEMITMHFESASQATSTQITISGFAPQTIYHKYEDNYHNHTAFTTDANGDFSYTQDLSMPHLVFIQPNASTKFIKDDAAGGDCGLIGIWNLATKSCTLTTDLTETIQIDSDGITLDGNGRTITGDKTGNGVYLSGRSGVTIRNLNVKGFEYGINMFSSINNTLRGNNISNNEAGIILQFSSNNNLTNNEVSSNNWYGIYLYFSSGNTLTTNIALNNGRGIYFSTSYNNTFADNTVSHNGIGIDLVSSWNNTFTSNTVSSNIWYGIYLYYSNNNKTYHNNFIDRQSYVYGRYGNLFNDSYPSGGNYWSSYTGVDEKSGANQDQPGPDGIGDTPYTFSGSQDKYPFMNENGWETPPEPQKWSFAVITDLHIGFGDSDKDYGGLGWDDNSGQEGIISTINLRESVNLINSNKDKYNIDFVVVTGDFSDSAELSELNKAKEILDTLQIPWVPIIGNHDVWPYYGTNPDWTDPYAEMAPEVGADNAGTDKYFYETFNSQYENISSIFQNWEKAEVPVWNLETDPQHNSYFQNFAFDYNDYHFIGLDFNARDNAPWPWKGVFQEGDLHNFSGGTWNWFTSHLNKYVDEHPTSTENIVLLAHHPFFAPPTFGFSQGEINLLYEYFRNYKDNIYGEFAGHTHYWTRDRLWYTSEEEDEEIMHLVETGANVKNPLVRVIQVYPNGTIELSKMLPEKRMYIKAMSPVDLVVTDPDGFIINKELNEIPEATYIETDIDEDGSLDDLITIPERKLGDYQIKVIPEPNATPTETYTLEVSTLEDSFGYIPIVLAENAPISEIPTEPYIFESKEKEFTQLTYTGNLSGQFSDPVNLTATLTDTNGNPLSGKTITFEIGNQSTSTITNNNGIDTASLILNQPSGKYYFVDAIFAGDEDYLPASDSKLFEIMKENVVITVSDKEGFAFDTTTLEAEVKDNDGDLFYQEKGSGYYVEFRIATTTIGTSTIDEYGKAKLDWNINIIPKEIIEKYPITVRFAGNDYYNPDEGWGTFTIKSAKWLKQEAINELEQTKTGNKKTDKEIDKIIWLINQSLDENLWLDASHLVFFEKDFENLDENEFEETFEKEKWTEPKTGIVVFHYEKVAVRLMVNEIESKKTPDELKDTFEEVIAKLVKADTLLAKICIYDAKNTPIQDPKFQKIVEHQITKAEEELLKAEKELDENRPDKVIMRFAKSWFHSQLAIKFANLEKRP